jgi:hypothetical protein
MIRSKRRIALSLAAVITLSLTTVGFKSCQRQPQTIANALHDLGNVKRNARAAGEITPQQDADITRKLDAMNRSYRQFVTDEQARLTAGKPDPSARQAALSELRSLLNGISDPGVLGFKSKGARDAWAGSIGVLNTLLAGFGG